MKSRQTLVFDPGGRTGRLRGCPFLGRVACWMDSFGRCNGSRGWSVFGTRRSSTSFSRDDKRLVTPYVLRLIAVPSEARLIRELQNTI